MLDNFLDNVSIEDNSKIKDSNKELGERVKKYTLINKYFDNYLRFNKKQVIFDFLKYLLIGSLFITYILNKIILNLSIKENLLLIIEEYSKLFSYIFIKTFNSFAEKLNILFIEILEITTNKIQIKDFIYSPNLELEKVFIGVSILLVLYFSLIIYQFLIQRDLFNSTFTNYYVPLWSLYFYKTRNKTKHFYIRLIRHQKQVNVISSYSKQILKNLFDMENLTLGEKDKINIELSPRKFLGFYDYYLLTYSINNQNQNKQQIEEIKGEIMEKIDNSQINELELLDLETLEKLDI